MPDKSIDIKLDNDIWEDIIENVEKTDVPVSCLKRITIKFENGKRKQISITKLRRQGVPDDQIENMLNATLTLMDADIKNVDFIVDVESVAKMVAPQTKELLNILKKSRK